MIIHETDRLILRHFDLNDAECFYFLNKDEEVMRYTGDTAFSSIQESYDFIKNYDAYDKTGMGRWTIELKENNQPIGWCGLKLHPNGMIDLGYRLHKNYWGKGIATEAAKVALSVGFEQLQLSEIIGRTANDNLASIRVLEKIGMTFLKKAPCEGIIDSVYYRIKKQEYLNL